VIFRSAVADPHGFLILPDMKWDLTTASSLYLVAITLSKDIRSLRDLTREHLDMLKAIRHEARRAVEERWGLRSTEIRCFVHYQPSYCKRHMSLVLVTLPFNCRTLFRLQITFTYTLSTQTLWATWAWPSVRPTFWTTLFRW